MVDLTKEDMTSDEINELLEHMRVYVTNNLGNMKHPMNSVGMVFLGLALAEAGKAQGTGTPSALCFGYVAMAIYKAQMIMMLTDNFNVPKDTVGTYIDRLWELVKFSPKKPWSPEEAQRLSELIGEPKGRA